MQVAIRVIHLGEARPAQIEALYYISNYTDSINCPKATKEIIFYSGSTPTFEDQADLTTYGL